MRAGSRSERTITLRRYWLTRLADDHRTQSPWALTPLQLTAWTARHHVAPETRRSIRQALRTFYGWAQVMRLVDESPALALPPVTIPRRRPRPAPETAVTAALDAATPRDALMVRLAANAGLRREEIASLRWSDRSGNWLTIRGKGGHERRIPLPAALVESLQAEQEHREAGQFGPGWRYQTSTDPRSPYVFPGLGGGHMHVDTVGSILSRLMGPYSGHTLRHRYATVILRGSRNLRSTQELLGHASILTTQVYTEVSDEDLMEAAQWAA